MFISGNSMIGRTGAMTPDLKEGAKGALTRSMRADVARAVHAIIAERFPARPRFFWLFSQPMHASHTVLGIDFSALR